MARARAKLPDLLDSHQHGSEHPGGTGAAGLLAGGNAFVQSLMRGGADAGSSFRDATSGPSGPVPYQAQMENLFNADLSGVRAWLGAPEVMSGGLAATRGDRMAFASGRPDPDVVKHELTHVLQNEPWRQQGGGAPTAADPEREAMRAMSASGAGSVSVGAQPTGGVDFFGWDDITQWGSDAWNGITETASAAGDWISNTASDAWDWTSNTASDVWDWAGEKADGLASIFDGPGLINWQDDEGNTHSLLNLDLVPGYDQDGGTTQYGLGFDFDLYKRTGTDGSEMDVGSLEFLAGHETGPNGEQTSGLKLGGGLYSNKDADGSTETALGLNFLAGYEQDRYGNNAAGLDLEGGLWQDQGADGSKNTLLGLDLLAGNETTAGGAQTSGLSLDGGLYQDNRVDGSKTSLLGLDFLGGYQRTGDGSMDAGLSLDGGLFQDLNADGSKTSILGLDFLAGHDRNGNGAGRSGLSLDGGLASYEGDSGAKFQLLGLDLLAGYQTNGKERSLSGFNLDGGLARYEGTGGGNFNLLGLDAFAGYETMEDGKWRAGLDASAGVLNAKTPDWYLKGGLDFLSLAASATATESEAGFNVGATLLGANGAVDSSGGNGDPNSKIDQTFLFEPDLELGVGLGGKVHYGDRDKDGYREWGLGFNGDPIPFGFDFTTEDPLRFLLGPHVPPTVANDKNMTEEAWNGTKNLWNEAWGD